MHACAVSLPRRPETLCSYIIELVYKYRLHRGNGGTLPIQQKEKKKRFWGFRMLSSIAFSRQKTDGVTHCFVPSVVGQGLSKPTSHYLFKWHWKFMSTDSALLHSCSNVFILYYVYILFLYFFIKHSLCPHASLGRLEGVRKAAEKHCYSSGEYRQIVYVHFLYWKRVAPHCRIHGHHPIL